eukprot:720061-Prymnesium_polylepis.1
MWLVRTTAPKCVELCANVVSSPKIRGGNRENLILGQYMSLRGPVCMDPCRGTATEPRSARVRPCGAP